MSEKSVRALARDARENAAGREQELAEIARVHRVCPSCLCSRKTDEERNMLPHNRFSDMVDETGRYAAFGVRAMLPCDCAGQPGLTKADLDAGYLGDDAMSG